MTTTTCGKCGKKFHKTNIKSAKQALAMHTSRVHGKMTTHLRNITKKEKMHADEQEEGVVANFCPSCGMNLHVLTRGMTLANRMRIR
jgi:hypothetical protein